VPLPTICQSCQRRSCEASSPGRLAFCEYDVAYYNNGTTLLRAEPLVPLRMLCTNLRHELHHILNLIVEQAVAIDPSVSIRWIDLDNPASRILAATVIVDRFIQMLTGVYEFHPAGSGEHLTLSRSLAEILTKYFSIYSIVKGIRRASALKLDLDFDRALVVPHCVDIYEYITSILMDNAWKYSPSDTTLAVRVREKSNSRADISFTNISKPITEGLDIFAKGVKGDMQSEGFGYGLYWATILIDYYNLHMGRTKDLLELRHNQELREDGFALHEFTLLNAALIREE